MAVAASLEFGDGRTVRIGPDERDVKRELISYNFDTELHGGFGPGTLVVPRPDRFDEVDARLLVGTRLYEAETNRTLHGGRVVGTPSVGVSEVGITIEGWAKHTEDEKTARALICDRDLTKWKPQGATSKIKYAAGPYALFDHEVGETSRDDGIGQQFGGPALVLRLTGTWNNFARCIAFYDAGPGLKVKECFFDAWYVLITWGAANEHLWACSNSTPDDWYNRDGTDFDHDGVSNQVYATGYAGGAATTPRRCFGWIWGSDSNGGGASEINYESQMRRLVVYGDHPLTKRGPNPGGFYASDIADYIVKKFAPLLRVGTDSIEATSFIVPQFAYLEDTPLREMLDALSLQGGNQLLPMDWGCYGDDGKEFFFKSPGTYGTQWRARRDQTAEPSDEGPDVQKLRNGAKVNWDDGSGNMKSIGPPGSHSDVETDLLLDADPSNPANQDGARHWESVDAGIQSQDGALMIGQMVLADARRQDWRGEVVLTGEAVDSAGTKHHIGAPRAGDSVVVEDDLDTAPRRVVGTSCDGEKNSLSIGARPDRLDVLLARSGIVLEGQLVT